MSSQRTKNECPQPIIGGGATQLILKLAHNDENHLGAQVFILRENQSVKTIDDLSKWFLIRMESNYVVPKHVNADLKYQNQVLEKSRTIASFASTVPDETLILVRLKVSDH